MSPDAAIKAAVLMRPFAEISILRRRKKLLAARQQLPIRAVQQALVEQVRASDVLVLVGETGSGKTTQVPQILMRAGLAEGSCIVCTQPRRVAAITVALRVAQEQGCKLGDEVWAYRAA